MADEVLKVTNHIEIPHHEFEFSYARSSGAGGQNVNKVASKAILAWNIFTSPTLPRDVRQRFLQTFGSKINLRGELVISSDRYRDQPQNRKDCLSKLTAMLAQVAYPPKPRKKTKPTKSSREKRLKKKKTHALKKTHRQKVSW